MNEIDIRSKTVFFKKIIFHKISILKDFIQFQNFYFKWNFKKIFIINETILYSACDSGNIELVKYILSLNEINIKSKDIFFDYFFNYISIETNICAVSNFFIYGILIFLNLSYNFTFCL